jgi:hypothetical protein
METEARGKAATTTRKPPVLIHLGKKKRKRVKKLSRGRGPLMGAIADAVEELRANGKLDASGQDVIVIVREKRRKRRGGMFGF